MEVLLPLFHWKCYSLLPICNKVFHFVWYFAMVGWGRRFLVLLHLVGTYNPDLGSAISISRKCHFCDFWWKCYSFAADMQQKSCASGLALLVLDEEGVFCFVAYHRNSQSQPGIAVFGPGRKCCFHEFCGNGIYMALMCSGCLVLCCFCLRYLEEGLLSFVAHRRIRGWDLHVFSLRSSYRYCELLSCGSRSSWCQLVFLRFPFAF
jgi:hypothetical protein